MSSLAEAQQILTVLADIESTLDRVEDQLASGVVEAEQATVTYADLYNVMQDVFQLARRLGLPPELEEAISVLQRVIMLMNQMRIAIHALELSAGPVGWLAFGISMAGTALTLQSFMATMDGQARL